MAEPRNVRFLARCLRRDAFFDLQVCESAKTLDLQFVDEVGGVERVQTTGKPHRASAWQTHWPNECSVHDEAAFRRERNRTQSYPSDDRLAGPAPARVTYRPPSRGSLANRSQPSASRRVRGRFRLASPVQNRAPLLCYPA